MFHPTKALKKESKCGFSVCCNIFSCGYSHQEFGQYVLPGAAHEPINDSQSDDTTDTPAAYSVTAERAEGCSFRIPVVLVAGCPTHEYIYKNRHTGDNIASLPSISPEYAAQHPENTIRDTVSTRSAHITACYCCGPHVTLSKSLGFFSKPETNTGHQLPHPSAINGSQKMM